VIPKFREWDGFREDRGRGMVYGVKEDYEDAFTIRLDVMEDVAYNDDGSLNRTIMMSSGLKDIHGKEYYEKDIVSDKESGEIGVVEYENGGFVVKCLNGNDDIALSELLDTFEIAGNVYERPYLLGSNVDMHDWI
jgi:hypothetical protein